MTRIKQNTGTGFIESCCGVNELAALAALALLAVSGSGFEDAFHEGDRALSWNVK